MVMPLYDVKTRPFCDLSLHQMRPLGLEQFRTRSERLFRSFSFQESSKLCSVCIPCYKGNRGCRSPIITVVHHGEKDFRSVVLTRVFCHLHVNLRDQSLHSASEEECHAEDCQDWRTC